MSEMIRITDRKKLLGALGLAVNASRAVVGVELVCSALKAGGAKAPRLVISACDVSDNTRKRIGDKCSFYKVKRIEISISAQELASALGKSAPIGAVGIVDESFCRLVEQYLEYDNDNL